MLRLIKTLIFYVKLKLAERLANRLSRGNRGMKYYVLKFNGEPVVCNKENIKHMKRRGLLCKSLNDIELNRIALYQTK
jgi:hypothetical protein